MTDETVTISKTEYGALVQDQRILNALYAGGVDNWEWYGESLRDLRDDDEEEGDE